ncbi:YbgC/FadM family acyl-CoA thioesterase [Novosphingobium sp. KACC 22771]|uniref:YbgC/FadM family acyl-CoA thioesterase n=1 Tax=Novosphingobium sp. KACC 22771 TaxID=3025670 RepID=UPI0023673585|nr:YbgC/FadM family acyl-CoA thioesterase [Novosphingobium sp. KACC 22771]WDF73383.1 YbgC/FadM family acyl-CoA thioesterase [Novosphingobium sp. KACC 22771]
MNALPLPPSGCFATGADGPLHLYAVRAYFEDTDLSGVVYHANYLRWFERARSDMLRLLNVDQRAAQEAGEGAYAVAEMTIRYAAPARLDDDVLIETRIEELGAASIRLVQVAFRRTGVEENAVHKGPMLAQARVRVGFVAPDGRPRRQPAAWRTAYAQFLAGADQATQFSSPNQPGTP